MKTTQLEELQSLARDSDDSELRGGMFFCAELHRNGNTRPQNTSTPRIRLPDKTIKRHENIMVVQASLPDSSLPDDIHRVGD